MKKKFLGILCIVTLAMIFTACGTSFSKFESINEGDVIETDSCKVTILNVGFYDNLDFISSDLKDTEDEKYLLISQLFKNSSQNVQLHSEYIEFTLYKNKEKYNYVKDYVRDKSGDWDNFDTLIEPYEEKSICSVIKIPNELIDNYEELILNINVENKNFKLDGLIPKTYEYIDVADKVFDKFTNLYSSYLWSNDVDAFLLDAENKQAISTCIANLNDISNVPYSQVTIHSTLLDVMKSFETMMNTLTVPEDGTGKWLDKIEELSKSDSWISAKANEFVKDANQITLSKMKNQINNYFN